MGDRLKVFGIDIIKGSVRSRSRRPMYALVRMEGPQITSETEVSFYRLFRLLRDEQPDILAYFLRKYQLDFPREDAVQWVIG